MRVRTLVRRPLVNDVSFDVRLLHAQAERYRVRHEYWTARAAELGRR